MNFPLITIPDPAEVGLWLDREIPAADKDRHLVLYDFKGWYCLHWHEMRNYVSGRGATPEALLADLREKVAAADPITNIRRQAEAAGFSLVANDQVEARRQ